MWLNKTALSLRSLVSPGSQWLNGAAVIVLAAMMFLTGADVILRYLFNSPVAGSLELTEFMMVLLVAFGLAYTAMREGMIDVDVLVNRLRPKTRAAVDATTSLISLLFFVMVTWRSIIYGGNLRAGHFVSQSLYIPQYPFAYLMALGCALLCLVYLIKFLEHLSRLISDTRWWFWSSSILLVLVIVFLFSLPAWQTGLKGQITPVSAGIINVVLLILILFSGMSIGIVMGFLGLIGLIYVVDLSPGLSNLGSTFYSTASSYSLSVIPLFILMGLICFNAGLSTGLYTTAYKWVGHLPGGLAIASIVASAGFAAVCGSSIACAAIMGTVALPEMRKHRYDASLATACLAAGGCLGILIPPSVILAIYGILTEQSIGKLFLAGFLPGILETLLFIAVIYIQCKRNPLMGPPGETSGLKNKVISLKYSWSTIVLFVLVIGGIYAGIFTPTEAAGVGAFGAFIIAISQRSLSWKNFVDSLVETSKTTAMCFVILIGSNIFGYFLAVARLPATLSSFAASLAVNRYIIIIGIIVLYLFLGMIISSMAMIVLTVPIFFPVVTALGFDPIWFGIIIVMVVEMGQLTPPVAINVFVIQGIAKDVPMFTIFRGIWPFLYAELATIALLMVFPEIATIVPSMMK